MAYTYDGAGQPDYDGSEPDDAPEPCDACGACEGYTATGHGWHCAHCGALALVGMNEPEPEPCDICGAMGLDFTLYVDAAGVGHNVCAACDAEPTPTDDAEDRFNCGGW